jgi:hypothetical protein
MNILIFTGFNKLALPRFNIITLDNQCFCLLSVFSLLTESDDTCLQCLCLLYTVTLIKEKRDYDKKKILYYYPKIRK